MDENRDRDLVLPPNTYAYVLDSTKGKVSVYVGPYKNSLSNTDQLVVWDERQARFSQINDAVSATKTFTKAAEGQYIVLSDPAKSEAMSHPPLGNSTESADLDAGRMVIIPGPATFPLWPGQNAKTIDGHHLRHNQYLLVRVYQPEQAQQHRENAILAPQTGGEANPDSETTPTLGEGFTMGQLMIIKGTDVSFYIPNTGLEVVPENGQYVREAATLERLEYSILLNENGEKRFIEGPNVVFPEPTETFLTDPQGNRKFRAIELNDQSGLYIKVIAPYDNYALGDELFITGNEQAIYFPRPEHSIIQYGDRIKHYAIAIPAGEGRYILDRTNGKVELVRGPRMFLPDPRKEVVVRRILDDNLVAVLYPGNDEAASVNEEYRLEQAASAEKTFLMGRRMGPTGATGVIGTTTSGGAGALSDANMMSFYAGVSEDFGGEALKRGTSFTPPRTIVLDTKYEGAVEVNIWPGYAMLITKKTGERRVELGPKNVLLEYDESPMTLSLSTSNPKNTDRLLETAYLRTTNNQVSDTITVETRDLVPVTVKLSYRIKFEGETAEEQLRWFDIENYVKVFTDHARSRLRNAAKHFDIQAFYPDTVDIVRDTLLGVAPEGGERPGLFFDGNGMRLFDVEVLGVTIENPTVGTMLANAMNTALMGAIELSEAEDRYTRDTRLENLRRLYIAEKERTLRVEANAQVESLKRQLETAMQKTVNDLTVFSEEQKSRDARRNDRRLDTEQEHALTRERNQIELERMQGEVTEYIKRMGVLSEPFIQAMSAFGDKNFVATIIESLGPAALASGVTTADLMMQVFEGTPFEGTMRTLSSRPFAVSQGDPQQEG